ncbi:MAG: universal stress protein [Comamonadaceae bacterium]|jgi:nucleotide-binding universal stress UspA family protein|uniref:Universal stress protein n=1 Tax=Hydrogenophaga borbori TaxID=2294117 RepID=A0A372ELF9_9BURK|nr:MULTISPECIES: universal stress protein [Hydrogenophaga]NCT96562.1 universal stress protein [Comamonadaceae bacterium]RFP80115.1 universal stress protein [Hydrogenophaga borbori]WQB84835.1 universal stress protein [Hydrogenophaga sp. SNF1]
MNPFKRILVPVDGSETSNRALEAAIQLARAMDGQIRVMHAIDQMMYVSGYEATVDLLGTARTWAREALDEAMATVKAAGVACDSLLIDELGPRLGESVAQAARDWRADLIVLGTHGRRGVNRLLLGSGAEQIIRLAPSPVMVIRPTDLA